MEGKLSVGMKCVKTRRVGKAKRALKMSEFNKKEKMEEYQMVIKGDWNVVGESEKVNVKKCHGKVYREGVKP